jgi:hypothetical protein
MFRREQSQNVCPQTLPRWLRATAFPEGEEAEAATARTALDFRPGPAHVQGQSTKKESELARLKHNTAEHQPSFEVQSVFDSGELGAAYQLKLTTCTCGLCTGVRVGDKRRKE